MIIDYNLEWSTSNQIAVGLGNMAYVWNADSGETLELGEHIDGTLIRMENDTRGRGQPVTAIAWDPEGKILAVSKEPGTIKVKMKPVYLLICCSFCSYG